MHTADGEGRVANLDVVTSKAASRWPSVLYMLNLQSPQQKKNKIVKLQRDFPVSGISGNEVAVKHVWEGQNSRSGGTFDLGSFDLFETK